MWNSSSITSATQIKRPVFIVLATWWKIDVWVSPALDFLPEKTKYFLFRHKDCSWRGLCLPSKLHCHTDGKSSSIWKRSQITALVLFLYWFFTFLSYPQKHWGLCESHSNFNIHCFSSDERGSRGHTEQVIWNVLTELGEGSHRYPSHSKLCLWCLQDTAGVGSPEELYQQSANWPDPSGWNTQGWQCYPTVGFGSRHSGLCSQSLKV